MFQQRTLKSMVTGQGVGLHSGQLTRVRLVPGAPGSGIVFVRTDLCPPVEIPATSAHVRETTLATTLGVEGATVATVEHLIAALAGLGVDNVRVELDGPEVPILDGSSAPWVQLITEAGGTVAQRRSKRFLVIRRPVEVKAGDKWARLEPANTFSLRCSIEFDHPIVNSQSFEMTMSDAAFLREVARARTFGFAKDVDAMHAAGLARGGSLDNAVVIDDFSIRNPDGLRFPDEFVRHKVLDAIGDLALLGAPIIGRYVGHKSGHALNTRLVAELLANPRCFEVAEFRASREAEGAQVILPSFGLGGLAPAGA
jgi:UDP-3-O-[3-hydroxymyristoyl] N-acetylglucosamine deacetylase